MNERRADASEPISICIRTPGARGRTRRNDDKESGGHSIFVFSLFLFSRSSEPIQHPRGSRRGYRVNGSVKSFRIVEILDFSFIKSQSFDAIPLDDGNHGE